MACLFRSKCCLLEQGNDCISFTEPQAEYPEPWDASGTDMTSLKTNIRDTLLLEDIPIEDPLVTSEPSELLQKLTARQRHIHSNVTIPEYDEYPSPPGIPDAKEYSEEEKKGMLNEMYKSFIVQLHRGVVLRQLVSAKDCSEIHCQLLDDFATLKLDQNCGRLIEFPLSAISKVYVVIRQSFKNKVLVVTPLGLPVLEHVVVVDFSKRKLAFLFSEAIKAETFRLCMEMMAKQAISGNSQRRGLIGVCSKPNMVPSTVV